MQNNTQITSQPIEGVSNQSISFSVKTAAGLIGLSERTLWNLIRSSELPAVHIGTRVLLLREDIEKFLKERADRTGACVRSDISKLTTRRNTHKVGA